MFGPDGTQPLMTRDTQTSPDLRGTAAPTHTSPASELPQSPALGRGVSDPAVCFLPAYLLPTVDGFIRTLLRAHHDGQLGGLRLPASQPVPVSAATAASVAPGRSMASERPIGSQERSHGLFKPLQAVGSGFGGAQQWGPHAHFRRTGAADRQGSDFEQQRRQRRRRRRLHAAGRDQRPGHRRRGNPIAADPTDDRCNNDAGGHDNYVAVLRTPCAS